MSRVLGTMIILAAGCRDGAPTNADASVGVDSDTGDTEGDTPGSDTAHVEGTANGLIFDPPRGVYATPLPVTVSHPTATAVRYTFDGSDPRTSETAFTAPLPLTTLVDPNGTADRFKAPGVVIRATVGAEDAPPAAVVTHTYLFLDHVVALSPDGEAPGPEWPAPNEGGRFGWWGDSVQRIDYGMDPDVTEDPAYRDRVITALAALPSVSLVTDLPNLFDEGQGIYTNAGERGREWERPCSLELLTPDNSTGFQANAGVRIRGGYSRRDSNPKHAFRFFFRGEHGTSKLRYPLFGDEGAAEYDKIDLRTSQNYSWSGSNDDTHENTMNRDVFSRDLQRALGRPYTRSRYYHLFINGVYWGVFQSQERAEDRYAATYFGGNNDDYDVVKAATDMDYTIEATSGTLDTWRQVWELTEGGFEGDERYHRLEGRDASGVRDPGLPVLVDIDNLIDYMLVTFFVGNFDGPASKFFANQNPNNFYAINNREDTDRGFVFFAHDSEHSLFADPVSITTGIDEDRVSIGEPNSAVDDRGVPDDSYQMVVTRFEKFHPQWLHHRLTESAAYRARFAGRARTLLAAGGPLSHEQTVPLFEARAAEIETAIIAESARWGDAHRESPRTKNEDWIPAVRRVTEQFLPTRTDVLIAQLEAVGLY